MLWGGTRAIDPKVHFFLQMVNFADDDLEDLMTWKGSGVTDEASACRWLQDPKRVGKWRKWLPAPDVVTQTDAVSSREANLILVLATWSHVRGGCALMLSVRRRWGRLGLRGGRSDARNLCPRLGLRRGFVRWCAVARMCARARLACPPATSAALRARRTALKAGQPARPTARRIVSARERAHPHAPPAARFSCAAGPPFQPHGIPPPPGTRTARPRRVRAARPSAFAEQARRLASSDP